MNIFKFHLLKLPHILTYFHAQKSVELTETFKCINTLAVPFLGLDETDVTLRAVVSLRGEAVRLHTLKVQAETKTSGPLNSENFLSKSILKHEIIHKI